MSQSPTRPPSAGAPARGAGAPPPDLAEKGAPKDGAPQSLDRRLYMQLHAFGGCRDARPLTHALEQAGLEGVLYLDVNDPDGAALLTFSEEEDHFVTTVRDLLNRQPFSELEHKPEFTMLGRTYSLGYEPNLEDWLLRKPRRTVLNPDWPWAVWYPLRRKGEFSRLPVEEQKPILREHGSIGHSFGDADLAHDIRLACHGMDKNDNDFVIGLVGRRLHPLSALVERMRKTVQTSTYMEAMGPFFVGKAVWRQGKP